MSINPFEFVNSISHTKKEFTKDEIEKYYNPYITARTLANYMDTVLLVNELNCVGVQIAPTQHFNFLYHSVRKKNRFSSKVEKNEIEQAKVKIIAEYFNCSYEKANEYIKILTDDNVKEMKKSMEDFGGIIK